MNLTKSIGKLFGARFASSVMSFIGIVFFSRKLGADGIGVFFLFQGVVSILMLPANFGLRGALEKRISGSDEGADYFSTAILLKILPIVVIGILIGVFHREVNNYIGANVALLVVLGLIVEESYQMVIHLLRGELRVSKSADLYLLRQTIWVLGGAIAIEYLGYGTKGLVFSWILGAIVAFILGMYVKSTPIGQPSRSNARSLFDYAKFDVISGAGSTLFSWLDVIVIGFVLTQTEVGAYETAWRLSAVAVMFGNAIRNAIFPQISMWDNSGNLERIASTLSDMITMSLFFVIPSIAGIVILSEELLGIIFGREFIIASIALSILIGQKLFQALNQTIGRTLQAMDFPDLAAYAMVAGLLANIGLNIVLVNRYGMEGAAVATFVSYGLMITLRTLFLRKHLPVRVEWKNVSWCVVAAGVMGAVVWRIKSIVDINGLFLLVSIVALGAVVYFVVIFISPSLRSKIIDQATNAVGGVASSSD